MKERRTNGRGRLKRLAEAIRGLLALPDFREVSLSRHVFLCIVSLGVLLLAGCGSKAGASVPTKVAAQAATSTAATTTGQTPTSVPVAAPTAAATSTPALTSTPGSTSTPTRSTPTPPAPTATAPAVTEAPKLVLVSVHPLSVAAGGTLTLLVHTAGGVQRAEVYVGSGAPSAPSPSTFPLSQGPPGVWTGTGIAPSVGGAYHFTVGLYSAAGRRFLEDNDAWNVQVHGGAGSSGVNGTGSGVKPLFADIPLAPPFSYGNPVEAVFNANGRTVNGSEVVSNTRSDISAATVAQFYSVHFPRSGWSTAGVTVPAGATSFSLSATSGSRVCIVQFSAGTVHIFYGS